ncbi:hypothetical protein AB0J80_35930 [Actinoplanes sp. NPDC049548]|uniref:hypothetical protein n=1 Tax=Actinoplanes sp. NPDC049548 TaxID=3155152 RepID=UPI003419A718
MTTLKPGQRAIDAPHLGRREADHRVTYLQHLGRVTRMRLGARDLVHDDPSGELWFRVGPGRPHRKILIALCADDTYAVEVGRLCRVDGLPAWISERCETGIYADLLAETCERLCGETAQ